VRKGVRVRGLLGPAPAAKLLPLVLRRVIPDRQNEGVRGRVRQGDQRDRGRQTDHRAGVRVPEIEDPPRLLTAVRVTLPRGRTNRRSLDGGRADVGAAARVRGDPPARPPGSTRRRGEVRPPREGGAPLGRRSLQDRGRVEGTRSRGGHPSRRRRQSRPALTRADAYFVRISSMKARARGSLDWPSQKIACLRTWGLRFLRATSIKSGMPSSSGIWVSAKTAFFLTSV